MVILVSAQVPLDAHGSTRGTKPAGHRACLYMYICIYVYMCIYIYIYMYKQVYYSI